MKSPLRNCVGRRVENKMSEKGVNLSKEYLYPHYGSLLPDVFCQNHDCDGIVAVTGS